MLTRLLVFSIGMAGMLFLLPVFGLLFFRQPRSRETRIFITSALIAGCMAGALAVWNLLPKGWPLSFGETLAASVNAVRYGHPVEHYAQCTLVLMWCASLAGALVCGAVATRACRR